MITLVSNKAVQSAARLQQKTQDESLMRSAMSGAGLTPWEARVLPELVRDIYFDESSSSPLRDGQYRYQCVAASDGAGKPLTACRFVTVRLSVLCVADDRAIFERDGAGGLRRARVLRLACEAYEQGGLLTQEDLGLLLHCDVRTIRRDIQALKKNDVQVPTRGLVQDIGPTLTHKGQAIQRWLRGEEPVAIARAIFHSLAAVERYLTDFQRISLLLMKKMDPVSIAQATHLSSPLVETYCGIYHEARKNNAYDFRFTELATLHVAQKTASKSGKKGRYERSAPRL